MALSSLTLVGVYTVIRSVYVSSSNVAWCKLLISLLMLSVSLLCDKPSTIANET